VSAVSRFVAFSIAGLAALAVPAAAETRAMTPKAVLELFTSQGCSSCPPADHLLSEYAQRPDVLALSFPVDYWDYLGWKDTLASHDNSERQRAYAAARGDGEVYTPQVVVNGATHVVGSDKAAIDAALKPLEEQGLPVPITMTKGADVVTVNIGAAAGGTAGAARHGTIWLITYDGSVSVPIERGENSGKTVTYSNVVRNVRSIAMWKGEAM
jgi:hypothetical protein